MLRDTYMAFSASVMCGVSDCRHRSVAVLATALLLFTLWHVALFLIPAVMVPRPKPHVSSQNMVCLQL